MLKASIVVTVSALSLALVGLTASWARSALAQPQPRAKEVQESSFACNRAALTPEQRRRHFDELGPLLVAQRKVVRELPNGYEFEFASDFPTVQMAAEWAAGEHVCCPFLDIELRLEREGGPLWLRVTGVQGVKQFLQYDAAAWVSK